MRGTICTVAFLLSLVAVSGALPGDERGEAASKPKQQCIVFCRWLDDDNNSFTCGIRSLGNGEKACIHPAAPAINIAIRGIRQSEGVTVDVTLEAAKADSHKIHVVKLVKFNETLAIPLDDKRANGALPRVEILIGAGDVIHWNWPCPTGAKSLRPEDARRQAIFDAILATGHARVSCANGSRLAALVGDEAYRTLGDGIDCVQDYSRLAACIYRYTPHRLGLTDALTASCPVFHEWLGMHRDEIERAVFGSVACYQVELVDGPALIQNVEALSRLPETSRVSVVIDARRLDDRLLQAMNRLRTGQLHVSDVAVDCLWSECESHAALKSQSRDDRIKMVSVNWQLAERAIPAFQKLPNLEEILILAAYEHEVKARESLKLVQKALPNAGAHLVFSGEKSERKEPRRE